MRTSAEHGACPSSIVVCNKVAQQMSIQTTASERPILPMPSPAQAPGQAAASRRGAYRIQA